jgi:hypothetical protein
LRLRYLGSTPITFMSLGLEVWPGDEFDVDDALASGFTGRADVEAVEQPKVPRRRPAKTDAPEPEVAPAAAPVIPEED